MPDPSRKRPTNQPGTEPATAGDLIQSSRLRWLHRLPLAALRHATVSTVPRSKGRANRPVRRLRALHVCAGISAESCPVAAADVEEDAEAVVGQQLAGPTSRFTPSLG
jgi:hypothetical protein